MADEPASENCRHCGVAKQPAVIGKLRGIEPVYETGNGDWLCSQCERWQHTTSCPTCGQPVSIEVLPAELIPEAAAPAKKAKGE